MESQDVISVLREILHENRQTNQRLEKLEIRADEIGHRQIESEMRLATEVIAVAENLREVKELLRTGLVDHQRVANHEHRITVLETKVV